MACIATSTGGDDAVYTYIHVWRLTLTPLTPGDTFMCHNILALKRRLTHLCVITEHAKFKLFSWHYKLGAATSATGVLLPGLLVARTANQ